MPPFRTLFYLLMLLAATVLSFQEMHGQQQPASRSRVRNTTTSLQWNFTTIDSLQLLNDVQGGMHRLVSPAQRPLKIVSRQNSYGKPTLQLKAIQNSQGNMRQLSNAHTSAICSVTSGRDFVYQDSLIFFTGDPTITSDGNVLLSGEFADYSKSPLSDGGFCMKTDINGNVIWTKLYDSTNETGFDYMNYFRSLELNNGFILLAGRTTNRVSGNDDFVLTMLDNNGNLIWLKTYESKFWQGFNGSGDYFLLRDLKEDPTTKEIYFVGTHWGGVTTITKIDPSDGHIIWSNGYHTGENDFPFGIIINPTNLFLFQLEDGYYNESYVDATAINKANGDTLFSKHFSQTGDRFAPRLYNTFEVVKLNNGHFRMSGPTVGYFEYPAYTGTKDLYHAGIIELDENFDFVKAWGFKNRIESNGYNTRVSLYPDGSGVFTMLKYITSYNADVEVCLFKDELIYHQRKRLQYNEGIPYEPRTLQLGNGGFLNIKLLGDSTKLATDGSRIDYYRMHTSDSASSCLGVKDSATTVWYLNFEPITRYIDSIHRDVFRESRVKTFNTWSFTTNKQPACVATSYCDTLDLDPSATTICPGSNVVVTIHKNKECGSLVPFAYDTNFVSRITKLTDTTYQFNFQKPGSGYIYGSLMGCKLRKDSVYVTVVSTRYSLELGNDTTICPGNKIELNAGTGFDSYKWQDGSADSIFFVTKPGKYYVRTVNSCGTVYNDTIEVKDHPPIPISIGPDRTKCNNDTVRLTASSGFISYSWSSNYNISSLTDPEVIVNPTEDTTYTLIAEKTPGCFAYDTVHIKVYTSPPIDLGRDTSICHGDTLVLNAGAGFSQYQWNDGTTDQQMHAYSRGTYIVVGISVQGCLSHDTLKIVDVYSLPSVNLDKDPTICMGASRTLNAGDDFISYSWNNGSISNKITVDAPGSYSVTVTDKNGCVASDTTTITAILPSPGAFLPGDTSICSYGKLELKSSGVYKNYLWNTNSTNPSINISEPGLYWLQVTDANNCTGKDTVIVDLKDCMTGCYVPSAFTPNNDGKNDIFRPLLFGNIKQYKFVIYNRWGQIVFQTNELGKGWDGTFGGVKQDPNVFVWTCTWQLDGGEIKTEKGTVALVR